MYSLIGMRQGSAICVGCDDGSLLLVDATSGTVLKQIAAHSGTIAAVIAARSYVVTQQHYANSVKCWLVPDLTLHREFKTDIGVVLLQAMDKHYWLVQERSCITGIWPLASYWAL